MEVIDTILDWVDKFSQLIFPPSDFKQSNCIHSECLNLKEVAEWFCQFSLTKGKDVPVLINAHSKFGNELLDKLFEDGLVENIDSYTVNHCFVAGSFNKESNAFEHIVVYTTDEISCELETAFKGNDIIALS